MSDNNIDYVQELIDRDKATPSKVLWKGDMKAYMELAREKAVEGKQIVRLSHATVNEMISSAGIRILNEEARAKMLFKTEKVYDFFSDEFFGIEDTCAKIARFFYAAANRGEESRQVLYLMGPVGSGKSSLVGKLFSGMEAMTFFAIKDCPVHEEPLHLVPNHLRKEVEKMLGVRIEGDLCKICQWRLLNEEAYNSGEPKKPNWHKFEVEELKFSKRARKGLAQVPPVDPNNQDTSVLIGSEDISKMDEFEEGDPRILVLNGALNVGNRGMVEFIEVFKNEIEYLHCMITATQEKVVPAPGKHGLMYIDSVMVAHSNEAEWQKFKADHTNEAILDRIVTVRVPYNLRLDEEVKIYQKNIDKSDFRAHIAPHTLQIASMFAILSRLEPTAKCDLLTKLKIYNGEEVIEKGKTKNVNIEELKDATEREGMSGISTRFIMKSLDNALVDNSLGNCINPINVREALINMVKETEMPTDTKKHYLELLQDTLHKEYLELLEKEITKAFVYSYKEQAEQLFQNYLDHAEAFVNKKKVKDRNTKEELQPDEGFMKSIEEQIAIIGSAADGFRQEVISNLWSMTRRGEKPDYMSYAPLKEAIEKKLINSVRDLSRVITKARTRDEEQGEKHDAMVKEMLTQGYCESCVDVVLKYAANNLWKD